MTWLCSRARSMLLSLMTKDFVSSQILYILGAELNLCHKASFPSSTVALNYEEGPAPLDSVRETRAKCLSLGRNCILRFGKVEYMASISALMTEMPLDSVSPATENRESGATAASCRRRRNLNRASCDIRNEPLVITQNLGPNTEPFIAHYLPLFLLLLWKLNELVLGRAVMQLLPRVPFRDKMASKESVGELSRLTH